MSDAPMWAKRKPLRQVQTQEMVMRSHGLEIPHFYTVSEIADKPGKVLISYVSYDEGQAAHVPHQVCILSYEALREIEMVIPRVLEWESGPKRRQAPMEDDEPAPGFRVRKRQAPVDDDDEPTPSWRKK